MTTILSLLFAIELTWPVIGGAVAVLLSSNVVSSIATALLVHRLSKPQTDADLHSSKIDSTGKELDIADRAIDLAKKLEAAEVQIAGFTMILAVKDNLIAEMTAMLSTSFEARVKELEATEAKCKKRIDVVEAKVKELEKAVEAALGANASLTDSNVRLTAKVQLAHKKGFLTDTDLQEVGVKPFGNIG